MDERAVPSGLFREHGLRWIRFNSRTGLAGAFDLGPLVSRHGRKPTLPKCASVNVVFSKKRGVNFCEDWGHEFATGKPFAPLRIFLSYGHDANEELVRRIKADLEKRGHDVWFDKNEIKFGDEWRRAITDGILQSNRVLSFLLKHSTRDPGVCLDEIAIAIGAKGGNIQTILVESEREVKPPPSISHLQWLDMHDWKERRAAGEPTWEQWYQAKLAEIVAVVESDESRRFAGEFAEIKRSLPFLIVLLGDRYGWVPPGDRMEIAAREAGFSTNTMGKSVTALEIEFGIFKESPEQQHRCFFCLRKPLPYEKLPEQLRAVYSEQFATDDHAAVRRKALNELKVRLTTDPDTKSRVRNYEADWDAEKKTVTGLTAWGDQVFEDLWKELDPETHAFVERDAPTWEDVERAALGEFIELSSRNFTGCEKTFQRLNTLAHSPATDGSAWGACVTGPPGSGKSAIFADLHRKLESDSNILFLSNAAGATMRGSRVDSMLRRWIGVLAAFLDVKNPLAEDATVENVDLAFALLLEKASLKKRVVVMIDALNQFEPTPRAKHLTWRPKPWPANARLITTALPGQEAESLTQSTGVLKIEVPPLTQADSRNIAHQIWKSWHVPWSEAVWQTLADKRLPDGSSASSNPLWTTLACEQLALLDADDFTRAEHQFTAERDPQARLLMLRRELAERMPPDVTMLYAWLFERAENIHGTILVRTFLSAIALSRHGWRESDLQVLIPRLMKILENQAGNPSTMLWNALLHAPHTSAQQYIPSYSSIVLPVAEASHALSNARGRLRPTVE